MISGHVDKFHDFLTLFVFYTNLKQLDVKFTVMLSMVLKIFGLFQKYVVTYAK
jgi:hypothetical protein